MTNIIDNQTLLVNEKDKDTIQRCPHDEENPYVLISRDLIRDSSISPDCRWLIIYLLSMKNGWNINIKQIISHLKHQMGRDKVYKVLNEALDAGYMKRETVMKKNLKQSNKYFVSEKPKFKKSFRYPCFQYPEIQYTENTDDKERTSIKKEHKKEKETHPYPLKEEKTKDLPKQKPKKERSAKASRVCDSSKPLTPRQKDPTSKAVKKKDLVSHGEYVKLTPIEHQQLCDTHGDKTIDTIIEEMNDYCAASRPKGYADYAAAIRQWMRKRLGEGVQPKKERKFAPCSNQDNALKAMQSMNEFAL